jgi:hypothetical protein
LFGDRVSCRYSAELAGVPHNQPIKPVACAPVTVNVRVKYRMDRIHVCSALLFAAISVPSFAGEHEPPPHKMIELAYFKCEASRNIEGGIYGKGPFKRFGPEKSACSSSERVPIQHEEFKRLATEWYGYDWSKEIPWWNRKN